MLRIYQVKEPPKLMMLSFSRRLHLMLVLLLALLLIILLIPLMDLMPLDTMLLMAIAAYDTHLLVKALLPLNPVLMMLIIMDFIFEYPSVQFHKIAERICRSLNRSPLPLHHCLSFLAQHLDHNAHTSTAIDRTLFPSDSSGHLEFQRLQRRIKVLLPWNTTPTVMNA